MNRTALGVDLCWRFALLLRNRHDGSLPRFARHGGIPRQNASKQLLHLGIFNGAVLSDEQLLEHALVQQPPFSGGGPAVLFATEPSDLKRSFQLLIELYEGLLGGSNLPFGSLCFPGGAIHLTLQQIERDGSGVVSP